jgi:hypothetical protein
MKRERALTCRCRRFSPSQLQEKVLRYDISLTIARVDQRGAADTPNPDGEKLVVVSGSCLLLTIGYFNNVEE